jgi:hypothetical protein
LGTIEKRTAVFSHRYEKLAAEKAPSTARIGALATFEKHPSLAPEEKDLARNR